MTERQEATAAPAPWDGVSPWLPAADRGHAGTAELLLLALLLLPLAPLRLPLGRMTAARPRSATSALRCRMAWRPAPRTGARRLPSGAGLAGLSQSPARLAQPNRLAPAAERVGQIPSQPSQPGRPGLSPCAMWPRKLRRQEPGRRELSRAASGLLELSQPISRDTGRRSDGRRARAGLIATTETSHSPGWTPGSSRLRFSGCATRS